MRSDGMLFAKVLDAVNKSLWVCFVVVMSLVSNCL